MYRLFCANNFLFAIIFNYDLKNRITRWNKDFILQIYFYLPLQLTIE